MHLYIRTVPQFDRKIEETETNRYRVTHITANFPGLLSSFLSIVAMLYGRKPPLLVMLYGRKPPLLVMLYGRKPPLLVK